MLDSTFCLCCQNGLDGFREGDLEIGFKDACSFCSSFNKLLYKETVLCGEFELLLVLDALLGKDFKSVFGVDRLLMRLFLGVLNEDFELDFSPRRLLDIDCFDGDFFGVLRTLLLVSMLSNRGMLE